MKKSEIAKLPDEIRFLATIQRLTDETEGGGKVTFSVPESEMTPFLLLFTKRNKVLEVGVREH